MLSPNVVPDFTRLRVAVVGDLIADRYLYARPTRISREAPVLVMRHDHEVIGAGGAANVARNLWALGAETLLIGAVGRNAEGRDLLRLLENEQIDVGGVTTVPEWTTPTKTRVLGAEAGRTVQQVLRIDREPDVPLDPGVTGAIADRVRALGGSIDALLVSDYGYGLVDEAVAEAALALQASGTMVVLDPRERIDHFGGVTGMTPNLAELARLAGEVEERVTSPRDVTRAAARVLERADPQWLLVTLGNRGMVLYARDLPDGVVIPASGSDQVIDVSGAGDTAAAAFTLGIAAGVDGPRAMRLANAASGVVVMESGTAVCTLSKLRSALPLSPQPAQAVRAGRP